MGRRTAFLLRALVSAALLGILLGSVNWSLLATIMSRLDLRYALTGSSLTGLLFIALAIRWLMITSTIGLKARFSKMLSFLWAGQFANTLLPGSTGGDAVRVLLLARGAHAPMKVAVASVLCDRIIALFGLAPLALWALLSWRGVVHIPQSLEGLGVLLGGCAALVVTALLGVALLRYCKMPVVTKMGQKARGLLFLLGRGLRPGPATIAALLLSAGIHLLNFLIYYLFARALSIGISFGQVLQILPLTTFILLIPVTMNGHGLREFLAIWFFGAAGIGVPDGSGTGLAELVVALSLVNAVNELLWAAPGVIGLLRGGYRGVG